MVDKKAKKLNDYKPEELEEMKSDIKKLKEQVGALTELFADHGAEIKEIKGKTYPGDIANAIREGFGSLVQSRASVPDYRPLGSGPSPPPDAPIPPTLQFDVFSITWKQRDGAIAPSNPKWGWAFGYNQDGGYHADTKELVEYLEKYKVFNTGNYTVKLGGRDNKLLQLNKK